VRLDAAGENPLTLASFQNASIGAWAWSADSHWIAISVYDNGSQVYVIRSDGSDLRQVYSGGDVTNMVFSPDGSRLLVEAAQDGLFHLYITTLEGGSVQILQAPGLRLDEDWMGVSWRYPPAG
jgi:Tol biopolymer transport system component